MGEAREGWAGCAEGGVGTMVKTGALRGGGERCAPTSHRLGWRGPHVVVALCYLPVWYRAGGGGGERGNCEVFSEVASKWGGCWHYVRSYSHSSNLPALEFGLEQS